MKDWKVIDRAALGYNMGGYNIGGTVPGLRGQFEDIRRTQTWQRPHPIMQDAL